MNEAIRNGKGILLGIDSGDKRTGVAVSDASRFLASARETVEVNGLNDCAEKIAAIAKNIGASGIILGLPRIRAGGRELADHPAGVEVRDDAGEPVLTDEWTGTAAELLMGAFYRYVLGVEFWSYRQVRWNFKGLVCLPFSLCWTVLALGMVYWLDPWVLALAEAVPRWLDAPMLCLLAADGIVSAAALKKAGTTDVLRWYT